MPAAQREVSGRYRTIADIVAGCAISGMNSRLIYWPSLFVAALGGTVVGIGWAYEPARTLLARPLALLAAAVTTVLFLRMLLDPRCHRGIGAANREMMGGSGFKFRLTPIFDPDWGIFGSRAGSPLLLTIRAILFVEFGAAVVLSGGVPDLLHLAAASFAVAMMLSLLNVSLGRTASSASGASPRPQ
ncbi:hypothetical protein [uncultured Brevundimonas sp.]|uniref:hypothetical protein n=1 Tax=uncultured Brevundimonas sp. TaxID=213418 RepID=UPI0030EC4327|tara:strand:+ start:959 stop:1519 length:561 start_codon:yes stop_codon:yes gene_type:complete